MSTCLELFYPQSFGDGIHCTLIFKIFYAILPREFFYLAFVHGYIVCAYLLNIDGTATLGQSGPESNGKGGILYTP